MGTPTTFTPHGVIVKVVGICKKRKLRILTLTGFDDFDWRGSTTSRVAMAEIP
jgi:hypothetical protein